MTLMPHSFSYVVVPVWFCSWDCLIPSGEGGYLILPLPYRFITKPFVSISNCFPQNSTFWVGSQHLSQDTHYILPSKVIKQSNTLKGSNIFLWVLQIVSQILLHYLYFLIRKGLINSHKLVISPGGRFMKRQQLVRLSLSLSGCSVHTTPGRDWRSLFFFMSYLLSYISSCISPLVLVVWVSLTSVVSVSIETRVVWGHIETGVVWTSTWAVRISIWIFYWDQGNLNFGLSFYHDQGNPFWKGSLTSSLFSLEPRVWG